MAMEFDPLKLWRPKITRIHKMWAQPCNIEPLMWFAGWFAATPVLFGSILSPDCLDATADRVRAGHRRRRRGSINVADYADPIAAPKGGLGGAVYAAGQLAQKAGFYLMLADAGLDFVIHGTSLAYRWSGCEDPNEGRATLTMKNTVPMPFGAGTDICRSWLVEEAHIYAADPTGIATPRGHASGVGFSITQHTGMFPPLEDCTFTARVIDRNGQRLTGPLVPEPGFDGQNSVTWFSSSTGAATEPHRYQVVITKTPGVLCVSGLLTASGANLEGATKSACGHNIGGI